MIYQTPHSQAGHPIVTLHGELVTVKKGERNIRAKTPETPWVVHQGHPTFGKHSLYMTTFVCHSQG